MNNSDTLHFDYSQPYTQLPHDYYTLYLKDKNYSYYSYKDFKKWEVYLIPQVLDTIYAPENPYFMVVGHTRESDEVIDGGDIVQEKGVKKKCKKL